MRLVATARRTALLDADPVRDLRRFNAPVQLAVAAAREVAAAARSPAEAALIALAPCHPGSPELVRWVRAVDGGGQVRINPTHTLHAVDNLALSVLSLALGNRAYGLSLGGAAGMIWTALELVLERDEDEVIVCAGDQDPGDAGGSPRGVALLFARSGSGPRLIGIERPHRAESISPRPHAADGALAMLDAICDRYLVPPEHGDGLGDIVVRWERSGGSLQDTPDQAEMS
jgi:hypothetical protein